jgi:hypothetical protein
MAGGLVSGVLGFRVRGSGFRNDEGLSPNDETMTKLE